MPEMLVAARAMQGDLGILRPQLVACGWRPAGKGVIGTVREDLHDIGRGLAGRMLEGAGYDLDDLGPDVTPQESAAAARGHGRQVVGMSALLTTTMQSMRGSIEALEDLGIGESVQVVAGGAPLTWALARRVRGDGCAPDPSRAFALVKSLLHIER